MRRFRVERIGAEGTTVLLSADASHHLLRVAKLARGASLCVFDGHGLEADAELADVDPQAVIRICGPTRSACPHAEMHLVLAVLKGDAMSRAVRMATEAGVTHIWPVISARTVAKGDHRERWTRIAQSAAQQCGRADVPVVAAVAPLGHHPLPEGIPRWVAAPNGPTASTSAGPAIVAIGPEGGWAPAEVRSMVDGGWQPVGLGPWVFRADTACAVAIAMLSAH